MNPSSPPHHQQLQEQERDQDGCPTRKKKDPGWAEAAARAVAGEARAQRGIALPLIGMNLMWFAKQAITTAFLGRLGDLELAAGTLGFSFANATGFAVLTGLCGAMDPICGQAHGAGNAGLLRRTLLMATAMLLAASVPIALLWLRVDAVLLHVFGQQPDISAVARRYVVCLLPDLAISSFLGPLKAYLSSQEVTLPTLFASAVGLAAHVPLTVWLSRTRGVEGVAAAVWLSDLATAVGLAAYVAILMKKNNGKAEAPRCGRWWWSDPERTADWVRLLRLAVPSCLNTCLEWWCYEILVLLTGRLPDARRAVAVIAVTLNFDYLLFAAMLSLSVSASVRVSNSLGAGDAAAARRAATISIMGGILAGAAGGALMLASRRQWARLYTRGAGVREGVAKAMTVMAALEVVNFPLNVCGGIVRGTARPAVGMYAALGGFYLVALPVAVALGFRARRGVEGLLAGLIVGATVSLAVLVVVIARMDWKAEADKARARAGVCAVGDDVPGSGKEEATSGNAGEV
ncbi:protein DETOXIFICATION 56-like [Lolium rigidum]|uniref:protein DETOXIFICATION 56-like n=1 Tax=Lolium rigidum TaxID=89674 RepID=UPI001F5D271E|nr:protein DETOXIFICATION 56-like [Lolium rigidum]